MTRVLLYIFSVILISACNSGIDSDKQSADKNNNNQTSENTIVATQLWATDSIFQKPESVIFYPTDTVLFVSNIAGYENEKNNLGFISRLDLNGKILNLKWIVGLNAPKGMAILQNKLYVADINELIEIDINHEKISKRIPVPGSQSLNDVAVDTTTNILYISDSEANRIFEYRDMQVSIWMDSTIQNPNGLMVKDGSLLVLKMKESSLDSINLSTKEIILLNTGIGSCDGIASTGNPGEYLVSNWDGEIYFIPAKGKHEVFINTMSQKINSADIEFIESLNLLLVPTFNKNTVVAYTLKRK